VSDSYITGIGTSLWLGTLLAITCALVFRALPAIPAAWRYRIWFAVLASCAAIPLVPVRPVKPPAIVRRATVVAVAPSSRARPAVAAPTLRVPSPSEALAPEENPGAPERRTSVSVGPALVPLLFAVALGGTMIGLVLVVGQLFRLNRMKRRATALDEIIPLVGDVPSAGFRGARLLVSDQLRQPSACGYLQPAILLPMALLPQLNPEQLRHLLLHEAAHLRRWDDWALLAERLLLLLCWWHPASWWVRRQLDTTRELACDALVAQRTDRRAYARTLVAIAEWSLPSPRAIAPGALQGVLSQRIHALMDRRPAGTLPARVLSGGLAIAGVSLAISLQPPVVRTRRIVSDTVTATHGHAGFTRGGAALRLDSLFTRYQREGFSGSVLVAQGDAILLDKGYGLADRESGERMLRSTRFSAAGMTKMFTAAAILVLEQEGRLRVSDRLHRWFPELPAAMGDVTIHQLLVHADGLTRLSAPVYRPAAKDFLAAVADGPASFAPGTGYRYNDFGHSILGVIIERETGRPYEEYIRQRFLVPAGMSHTSFEPDGDSFATEYSGGADALRPIPPRAYTWGRRASLGLVSTTGDLFRWSRAMRDPRILPINVWNAMQQTFGRTDWRAEAGYGWDRMPAEFSRGALWRRVAGTPGMEGELLYNPATDWTAVILVNSRLGWRFKVWRALVATDTTDTTDATDAED
jgi:CubicO group peptidase (beta-lactamase class C family)/beta-lactamase regulating signal transducer with metallopeptidase domain